MWRKWLMEKLFEGYFSFYNKSTYAHIFVNMSHSFYYIKKHRRRKKAFNILMLVFPMLFASGPWWIFCKMELTICSHVTVPAFSTISLVQLWGERILKRFILNCILKYVSHTALIESNKLNTYAIIEFFVLALNIYYVIRLYQIWQYSCNHKESLLSFRSFERHLLWGNCPGILEVVRKLSYRDYLQGVWDVCKLSKI